MQEVQRQSAERHGGREQTRDKAKATQTALETCDLLTQRDRAGVGFVGSFWFVASDLEEHARVGAETLQVGHHAHEQALQMYT